MTDHSPSLPTSSPVPQHPDRWDLLRFILLFLLSLVLGLLVLIALAAVTGRLPTSQRMEDLTVLQQAWLTIGLAVAIYVSLAGSVWFAVQRRGRQGGRVLGYVPISPLAVIGCALGMIVYAFAVSFLITAIFGHVELDNPLADMAVSDDTLVATILIGCVVAPIAEEMLFRGLLFGWLRAHWPFWPTALVTAVLFGAAHGKAGAMYALIAGLMGVGLAVFREYSGSLWGSTAAHMANNLLFVGISLLKSDWF
jgi:membrane protease YdiL (CAAX protease family)